VTEFEPLPAPALIASALDLHVVMQRLSAVRPVFHSEADFQHAFARTLWELDPDIRVRLEVPRRAEAKWSTLEILRGLPQQWVPCQGAGRSLGGEAELACAG
jgi:hypothetical protein